MQRVWFTIKKANYLMREMWILIHKHKYYFLTPLMIALIVLALLVYYVGPAAIIAFIYAGV